jgi:protein-tyrosine phosphatase
MASNPAPSRHLPMEGAYNIRDIGGYPIESGGNTRWKTFLRADNMSRLTGEDQAALVRYGVRTVVDLRTSVELVDTPNVFGGSSEVSYVHHNIVGDERLAENEIVVTGVPADRIRTSYTRWLDTRQAIFHQILALLADPAARPAIYHCAGGKDRTGVISALLLDIAGVSRETIAEDYALTARYLLQRNLDGHGAAEQDGITTPQQYEAEYCPPEGMMKTLQHLDDGYGGVEEYMQAIGLSDEQIESLRGALAG